MGLWLWGCGGEPEAEAAQEAVETSGDEEAQPDDMLQVEGLKGTLSPAEVQNALEPRMLKFAVCPSKSSDVEFLWGEMAFHFTVGPDGRVRDVYGTRSSLGDRGTERCMIGVAHKAKFPRPHGGGEAEFDWSLEIPPDPNVREPVEWPAENVAEQLAEAGPDLAESCGGGPYTVTAYVDTDGTVMGVGVVDARSGAEEAMDCIAAGVEGWTFESPGSYPAKVTFTLP